MNVIFGASKGGEKVFYTLHSIGVEIAFFVDNDPEKWGREYLGKKIYPPDTLTGQDVSIIIAAEEYQESIEGQLAQMGMLDSIVLKEDFLVPYTMDQLKQLPSEESGSAVAIPMKRKNMDAQVTCSSKVYIELLEGCPKGAGGIVTWSMTATRLLKESGVDAHILSSARYGFPEGSESLFLPFETEYSTYWSSVMQLVDFLSGNLPCIIISNKQLQMFYAGIILKNRFPGQVTLYSVIHSDLAILYRRAAKLAPFTDRILCTTQAMKTALSDRFGLPGQLLSFKEMPVSDAFFLSHTEGGLASPESPNPIILSRQQPGPNQCLGTQSVPIKIAWGARLVKSQKRADLLIPLIQELEQAGFPYSFQIAGSGGCADTIQEYINSASLHGNVVMLGQLKREEMPAFWQDADISICLSEKEGACLSLLEAMACGAVPVTTGHSGASEVIEQGVNGFIIPFGDCRAMAEHIHMLASDRTQLAAMQTAAAATVKERYTMPCYRDYLLHLLQK